jgi:hypothetical protein
VLAPRQIKHEMCTVMHAQLAFGAGSRIRDNDLKSSRESESFPFASTGTLTACLTARICAQSAILCPAVTSRDQVRGGESESMLAAIRRTRRDEGHQLAEDEDAARAAPSCVPTSPVSKAAAT